MKLNQIKYILTHLLFAIFIYQMVVATYYIKVGTIVSQSTSSDDSDEFLSSNVLLEEEVEHHELRLSFCPVFYSKNTETSFYTEVSVVNTYIKICTPPPELI